MLCDGSCTEYEYCNPHFLICTNCSIICYPSLKEWEDCRNNCPVVWKQLTGLRSSTTVASASTTTDVPEDEISSWIRYLLVSITILVIIFIICILLLTLKKKRLKSGNHHEKADYLPHDADESKGFTLEDKKYDSADTHDADESKCFTVEDKEKGDDSHDTRHDTQCGVDSGPYLSLQGHEVTQPSADWTPEEFSFVSSHRLKHDSYDENTTAKTMSSEPSMLYYHGEPSLITTEQHSVSQNNKLFNQMDVAPHQSVTPHEQIPLIVTPQERRSPLILESIDGCRASEMSAIQLSSSISEDDHNTNGVLVESALDLRSDVDDMQDPHPGAAIRSRETTANDSGEPFRHVMRAYDAFDANQAEMSFARGCLIGNDQFQVFVSDSRDQGECYDRVMNIMPSTIREDVVVVEPETPIS